MKRVAALTVLVFFVTAPPLVARAPQTARQYYDELLQVKGLNPLFTFVCFHDDAETFAVFGRSSEFEATLKRKGLPLNSEFRRLLSAKSTTEFLYWQTFHKGVAGDPWMLVRGSTANEWSMEFGDGAGQTGGQIQLNMTWPTLRYRLVVNVRQGRDTGNAAVYGRCEPIPGAGAR